MALNDAALVIASTAVEAAITHMQLHSGARGGAGTSNVTAAARVAVSGTVDADGDITWSDIAFTGGAADGAVAEVSYWTALTAGTYLGGSALTGDAAFNADGEYTVDSVVENCTGA
jgi:hypothetical protein